MGQLLGLGKKEKIRNVFFIVFAEKVVSGKTIDNKNIANVVLMAYS